MATEEATEETTEAVVEETSEETASESSFATDSSTEGNEADGDTEAEESEGKGDEAGDSDESAAAEYTDFNIPEGLELEGERLGSATELFKGLGLNQETAQSVIDWYVADQKKQVEKLAEETKSNEQEATKKALTAIDADPVLGGPNKKGTQAACGKATFGFDPSNEFYEFLNTPGPNGVLNGNDIRVVRFLTAVGNAMAEDSGGSGGSGSPETNMLDEMYPTMASN